MGLRAWMHSCMLFAAVAAGIMTAPTTAHAVELYWDGHQVVRRPTRYLYVAPPQQVLPLPVEVRVVETPPSRVLIRVSDPEPQPQPPRVDPYRTDGSVILGAGVGGLVIFGDETYAAAAYKLHLGVAMGQAEFALRFDLAPGAVDVLDPASGAMVDASLYTAGASFGYRFLPDAFVHPVLGIGVESIFLNPEGMDTSRAFGATARFALELAVPVSSGGAFALGMDVTGHHPFVASQGYLGDRTEMVGFGAYADYRF